MVVYKTELDRTDRVPVLVKEKELRYDAVCQDPESVVKMLNYCFNHGLQTEEVVYEICFSSSGKPIAVFEISRGGIAKTLCGPREIFQKALMVGAASIIIAHNHPSGDCMPSDEDLHTAKKLMEAGKLMEIQVLDFIIVTDSSFFSYEQYSSI